MHVIIKARNINILGVVMAILKGMRKFMFSCKIKYKDNFTA